MAGFSRLQNYRRSWKTNQKIIVIESDDWGSIRTSSKDAYNELLKHGYDLSKSPYTLDALESNEDLTELYNVLMKYRDAKGNPASLTANMIMANPDFEKIKKSQFRDYSYEPVSKTLANYTGAEEVRDLWRKGKEKKLFVPQLHAREHVRYWEWMEDLRNGYKEAYVTFNLKMCGVPLAVSKENKSYFKTPYIDDSVLLGENVDLNKLITDGVNLFHQEFGYNSLSTIAPNCGWTPSAEKVWKDKGIKYIQGGYLQEYHQNKSIKYIPHFLGEKIKESNQFYLVRNCTFEPAKSENPEYWKSTFSQIENVFKRKNPAIISSHRVNYIGSIKVENRVKGLNQLNLLLNEVKKKWPDVLFLNTVQLGELISKSAY